MIAAANPKALRIRTTVNLIGNVVILFFNLIFFIFETTYDLAMYFIPYGVATCEESAS